MPVGQGINHKFDYYITSFCIAKYDGLGKILQYTKYKTSHSLYGMNIKSVSLDSNNNLYLCSSISCAFNYYDTVKIDTLTIIGDADFNVKIDNNGKAIWLKKYTTYVTINKSIIDNEDNIIVVGSSYGENLMLYDNDSIGNYGNMDGIIIKYDKLGNILWCNHIGSWSNDGIMDVSTNNKNEILFSFWMQDTIGKYDNNIIQTGSINCLNNESKFICKVNEIGKLIWFKPLIQSAPDLSKLDIINVKYNSLLGIDFYSNLQYDSIRFKSSNISNSCLIKIDSNGNSIWSKQFGSGIYSNNFEKILTDRDENAFVLGSYSSKIQLDNFNISSNTNGKFLCKLLNDSMVYTKINYNLINNQLIIFPNPANNEVTIKTSQVEKESTLSIYNINGQELLKQQINRGISHIDISNLTSGFYIVKLVNNNLVETAKIEKK